MSSSGLAKDDVRDQLGLVWFSFSPVGQFPLLTCFHAPAGTWLPLESQSKCSKEEYVRFLLDTSVCSAIRASG